MYLYNNINSTKKMKQPKYVYKELNEIARKFQHAHRNTNKSQQN